MRALKNKKLDATQSESAMVDSVDNIERSSGADKVLLKRNKAKRPAVRSACKDESTDMKIDGPDQKSTEADQSLPCNVWIVDSQESLDRCKQALAGHTLIAWDCEGIRSLGRSGKISIVQLATPSACFLLDFLASDACPQIVPFVKAVLEDPSILKIIHDPAADSDALLHLHGITVEHVHDTQAWHMELLAPDNRPPLNQTLEAFGVPANHFRDSGVYRVNPEFWAQRPLARRMVDWASADVARLFALHAAQAARAAADPPAAERAAAASATRVRALRDAARGVVHVHPTQAGALIGPRGTNIARLQAECGAVIQRLDRDRGLFEVYAPTDTALAAALAALAQYEQPYVRQAAGRAPANG
jgi:hypothetical protein